MARWGGAEDAPTLEGEMDETSGIETNGRPRLERSPDGILTGVAAGLADHLNVDATLVRVLFAVTTFVGGAGAIAYVAMWALLPRKGEPSPDGSTVLIRLLLVGIAFFVFLPVILFMLLLVLVRPWSGGSGTVTVGMGGPGALLLLVTVGFVVALIARDRSRDS